MTNTEALKTAKILVVDDEPDNILLLETILRQWGYDNLITATNGRDALKLFQKEQPDLVFLDLMMPKMDGFEVLEQLQPLMENQYVPIVVLTANSATQAKRRALAGGAKDFLTKPYDALEVLLRLQNMLETRFLYLELQNQRRAS